MVRRLLVLVVFTSIGLELSACFREAREGKRRELRAKISYCLRKSASRQDRKELYAKLSKAERIFYHRLSKTTRRRQRQDARAFKAQRCFDETCPDSVAGPDDVWEWENAHDAIGEFQSSGLQSRPILGRYISVHSVPYLQRPE